MDRRRSLDGIPVRNTGIRVTATVEDTDVLTVRSPRGTGLLARFQPPVLERTVKLDELGTFVFRLIDGRRTALEIVEAFAARYRLNRREAELSCIQFIRMLAARQVISVAFKRSPSEQTP